MLTVLINERYHYCFALRGSQLFYYSDGGYGMSAVLGTNATPRADSLGEEMNSCSKAIALWLLIM